MKSLIYKTPVAPEQDLVARLQSLLEMSLIYLESLATCETTSDKGAVLASMFWLDIFSNFSNEILAINKISLVI